MYLLFISIHRYQLVCLSDIESKLMQVFVYSGRNSIIESGNLGSVANSCLGLMLHLKS